MAIWLARHLLLFLVLQTFVDEANIHENDYARDVVDNFFLLFPLLCSLTNNRIGRLLSLTLRIEG